MWLRDRSYDILVRNEVGCHPCLKDLPGATLKSHRSTALAEGISRQPSIGCEAWPLVTSLRNSTMKRGTRKCKQT